MTGVHETGRNRSGATERERTAFLSCSKTLQNHPETPLPEPLGPAPLVRLNGPLQDARYPSDGYRRRRQQAITAFQGT
jgi:hypothetical protein